MKHISVIIPVLNDPTGIRTVLEALTNQSFPKRQYEIIVVDNGSMDHTLNVVESFQHKHPNLIRSVIEGEIKGAYAARNAGIRISAGSLIAFTDADCIPAPDWLEKGLYAFNGQDNLAVAGRIEMFFTSAKPTFWERYDFLCNLNQEWYVNRFGFGATANLFVVKRIFDSHGLFLDHLQSGGDYEFGRRMTKAGKKIRYADNAVVKHPTRSNFRSILKKNKRVAMGKKNLSQLNLLDHNQLNLKSFLPTRKIPNVERGAVSFLDTILLLISRNFLRYHDLYNRIL